MYESTVDVLYQLYDKLSIGGYVIMDDVRNNFQAYAMNKFFSDHASPYVSFLSSTVENLSIPVCL